MEDYDVGTILDALSSRYRLIAFSLSSSIMAFCAIDRTLSDIFDRFESPFFPRIAAALGSGLSSGGACAISFRRLGADDESVANSFGGSLRSCF